MPDEHTFALRQADQTRADFALIDSNLEFIMGQLARVPTRPYLVPDAAVGDGEHLGLADRPIADPIARGLDRALFQKLTNGEWIDAHDNLILCGPTGVGKSWLACALGHKACRDNRSVLYQRVPKLFPELALARGDGRYARILRGLTGVQLLILDDWGLEPLDAGARRDLYEILEERYGRRSTILTSQIPVDKWHAFIGDPTYADAILDRLVHNAHRIDLAGESLRRKRSRSIAKD